MTLIWSQQGQNKLPHHQTVCCTFPLSATKNLFERVDIWKLYVVNFLFKSFGQDIIRLKDITVDIYQCHKEVCITSDVIHGPSIGLFDRAVAYNQTRCGRHYTPTISRKGFSSSRVAYYPNSVSSFQTSFLMRSGDINPNPGPVNSSAANPEPQQDGFNLRGLHTFYANARSIVNKLDLLELEMSQRNYDLIVLTETHLDHSILDSEIFPSHYTVFRKDRTTSGRHGGGVLIAFRDCIPPTLRITHQCDSNCFSSTCYSLTSGGLPLVCSIGPLEEIQSL